MAEAEIFKLFLLVMVRFGGLLVSAPVLGSANFPVMAKVGLSALSAMIVTPLIPALDAPLPEAALPFGTLAIGEFLIGLLLGFFMTLVFAAIQVAGQVMDMQTGFALMNVFNPALEIQFPIYGFFLFILAVLYLLIINGHHLMIQALVATYDHIPVGGFMVEPELLWETARLGRIMFVEGLMIAAPVAAAMLLAYLTLGLLGRVVPQVHLFVVGFPITIAGGLIITAFMIDLYFNLVDAMFFRMFKNVEDMIPLMG